MTLPCWLQIASNFKAQTCSNGVPDVCCKLDTIYPDWNSIDSYQLTTVGIPLPTKIRNRIAIQASNSTIEAVPALAVRVVIFVWIPFIRFSWLWPHGKYQIWTNNIALLLLTTTNDCSSTSWSSTSHLCHMSIVALDVVCIPASHISASGRGSNSGRRRRGRLGWRNVSVRLVA